MPSIRKRGDKWQVQVRRKGQPPISRSFLSKKDAQLWGRQMEAKADRHDLPPDPKALERFTLGDLVRRYRDEVTSKKRGHEQETYILNAFLRHAICSKRLSDLTGADFRGYADERLQTIKPVSLHRQLAPIHNLYEVARRAWQLPIRENPLDSLDVKAPQGRRERRLSAGEFERLIQAAKRCRNSLIEPIIRLAIETGMRRGEILAVQSEHVDWQRRSLLIPHTKNGHPRVIPLTRTAMAVLEPFRGIHDRLFPLSPNAFRLAWERTRRRAGLEDLHFHDLRHEAISRFFELKLTIPEVASISGHRDARMLFRYAHARNEAIMAKLDCSHGGI